MEPVSASKQEEGADFKHIGSAVQRSEVKETLNHEMP
jgi:hypothetical protein